MAPARIAALVACVLALSSCGSSQPQAHDASGPLADGSDRAVAAAIDAISTFPSELDPRIWTGTEMKPDVRASTLRIVDRLVQSTGIDDLVVDGVDLFGSNASYEYDDTSDFGVHVFVHSPSIPTPRLKPLLGILNDDVERRQENRIKFYGVPVEVSFHAERTANYQPRPGVGQYSISEGRWVQPPTRQPDNFDRARMTTDAKAFIAKYNALVSEYLAGKKGFDCARFQALDDEMSAYRNEGFADGLGSRSTQNLTYRALRRLNVSIPDMVDTLEDDCTFAGESLG
jgi:hypothetical protein